MSMRIEAMLSRLKPLLALAALAPSSHNSQPWHVRALSLLQEGEPADEAQLQLSPGWPLALCLELDHQRRLQALPSLQREMLISLGGFAAILLNLLRLSGWAVEACSMGRHTSGVLLRLGSGPRPERADPAALARLTQALQRRQTERGPYRAEQPLRFDCNERLLPHGLGLSSATQHWRLLDDAAGRGAVAAFYAEHAARDLLHRSAWSETYAHLHFGADTDAAAGAQQGIAIERLFGPMSPWRRRSLQLLLHPALVARLGPRGMAARAGATLQALIGSSPALLYLAGPPTHEPAAALLQAGARIADLWLLAASHGQALHPLSVALQHEDLRRRLSGLLGCSEELLFIARAGTPREPLPAPRHRRRPPEAFLTA